MDRNRSHFTGSIVALVTPMYEHGDIDYNSLRQLIDWHVACGTDGLVIMGTTGESSLVSVDEHIEVVKVAIAHAQKRISIIAGCGSTATFAALELVKKLNPLKPDGYLCVTPYYVKPSQVGLIEHFSKVADVCESPLLLYNVPGRTACDLTNESIVELAKHQTIVGIKDAVGDIKRAKALFSQLGNDFVYLSGDDISAFDFIDAGGHGVISVTGNIAPEIMKQWCQIMLTERNIEASRRQARAIFEQLMPLHQKLFVEANPIPVKWALAQMKRIKIGIRLPLTLPGSVSQNEIAEALIKSGQLHTLE